MEPILNFGMKVLAFVIIIIYRYIKRKVVIKAYSWQDVGFFFLFFFKKKKLIGLVCSVFLLKLD